MAKSVYVFEAVDGSKLDAKTDRRIGVAAFHSMTRQNALMEECPALIDGLPAVGCSLSHIALWRLCLENGTPIVVVEDDVEVEPDQQEALEEACGHPADFVSLVSCTKYPDIQRLADAKQFSGTQAYCVRPSAAKLLLEQCLPIEVHVDIYIAAVAARYGTNWIKTFPEIRSLGYVFNTSTIGHPAGTRWTVRVGILLVLLLMIVGSLALWWRARGKLEECLGGRSALG